MSIDGRLSRALLIVLLGAGLAAACGGSRSLADERAYRAAHGTGEILVGAAWPWEQRKGVLYWQGMEMAVQEANTAGGVHGRPLRIVREDDQETVDGGRVVAQRLSNDPNIVAVIGHLESYVSMPAAAIYDLAGLLMIAPSSTDPELTGQGYRRVFRTIFTDREVGRQMAEYAAARNYKRVAIYYIRTRYGRSLANAFEERAAESGMTVVDRQSYDPTPSSQSRDRTLEELLDGWRKSELSAIFIAGEAPQAARFIAQARKRGMTLPILGGDALGAPDLIKAGNSVDGTVIASPFHPDERRPEVQRFVSMFRSRYGEPPDVVAALAYDAVQVLVHAMNAASSPAPDQVAAALRNTKGLKGVTGEFTFNPDGDLIDRSIIKVVVRNGRFECLDTAVMAQAR